MALRRIGYSFLGVKVDAEGDTRPPVERRGVWRPTVAFCAWLKLDELRLIYLRSKPRSVELAEKIGSDVVALADLPSAQSLPPCAGVEVRSARARTEVVHDVIDLADDPWELDRLYVELRRLIRGPWRAGIEARNSEHFVHLRTGHTAAQIAMYQLALAGKIPARVVHTISPTDPILSATDREKSLKIWGSCRVYHPEPTHNPGVAYRWEREELTPTSTSTRAKEHREKHRDAPYTREIERFLRLAIHTREPVLLLGETGTGKTTLAKEIHEERQTKLHRIGPLVSLNCATLTGDTLNSELFGHAKGSFTGASETRRGLLGEADGGTLFLDEVGELPLDTQARLLKALDEKTFRAVGATKASTSDFLLIAATNRDLRELVRERRFREDLLCRLDVFQHHILPLRERREEFESVFDEVWHEYASNLETGKKIYFRGGEWQRYLAFARSEKARWDGNLRDLRASAARLVAYARARPDGVITSDDVEAELSTLCRRWGAPVMEVGTAVPARERARFNEVAAVCRASKTQAEAARKLFAESKAQNKSDLLAKYLARFGYTFTLVRSPPGGERDGSTEF